MLYVITFKCYIAEEEAPKRGRGARRSRTSKKVVDEGIVLCFVF